MRGFAGGLGHGVKSKQYRGMTRAVCHCRRKNLKTGPYAWVSAGIGQKCCECVARRVKLISATTVCIGRH
jgi:hypothetical protein